MEGKPNLIWISYRVVRAIQQELIAEHGGCSGLRDEGLLMSALSQPQQYLFYQSPEPSLAAVAAIYAYSLAMNHPFLDGNKRTALTVSELFIVQNGLQLDATEAQKYDCFVNLGAGRLSKSELIDWFELHTFKKVK